MTKEEVFKKLEKLLKDFIEADSKRELTDLEDKTWEVITEIFTKDAVDMKKGSQNGTV